MKKIVLLILLVLFQLVSSAQTTAYYWSNKRKISLTSDSANWRLITLNGNAKNLAIAKLAVNSSVDNFRHSIGSKLINFTLKAYQKGIVQKLKRELSQFGEITCQHLAGGTTPITITGEILLQPKKSVSIEKIIEIVKSDAELIKSTEYNTFVLKAIRIENSFDIANKIYESGLVDWCHPDFWAEIVRNTNDPLYNQQYYLNQANNIDINAPEAWAITQGCDNLRVALIDDGAENHEDINGRVLQGFTSRDLNGFGAPVANLPPANLYTIGHGQACAGIIAATQDNNLGIAGIAPNSRIVPVNIFSDWFIFTDQFNRQSVGFNETPQNIAMSINWAWNPNQGNAHVLSNSWGYKSTTGPGGVDADAIRQAITNARTQGRNNRGSIVVFASGNENNNFSGVTFPANVDGVITVGAIDRNGAIQNYSSRGPEMDLVAPSGGIPGDVVTTDRMGANGYNNGNYTTTFNGTSAACPQVSGVAALMLSINPNLTEVQARAILQQTATDMGATGFDNTFGYGRVNAQAALLRVFSDAGISVASSSSLVCTTSQFSVTNLPAGSTVTWSSSNPPGLSINTTTGVATRASGYNGQAAVSATINCGAVAVAPLTVWVGNPPADIGTLIWTGGNRGVNPLQVGTGATYAFNVDPVPNTTSYTWLVPFGFVANGPKTTTAPSISITTSTTPGTYTLYCRANNACGSSWTSPTSCSSWTGPRGKCCRPNRRKGLWMSPWATCRPAFTTCT